MAKALRPLLQKNVPFLFLDKQKAEFNNLKTLLAESSTIHPFDQSLPTELLTDASNVHGIGYVLLQVRPETEKGKGQRRDMIRCGSRSLT